MSSKSQRDALVKQFRDITHATVDDASRLLKMYRWSIDHAIDAFWNDPVAKSNAERAALSASASYGPKLEALFDHYASQPDNQDPHVLSIDSTLQWCADLGIDPEDPAMLCVAHMCKAKEMGSFARADWVNAWKLARKDSIAAQKTHIDALRTDLQNSPPYFRKIYAYAFDYARDPSQRSLPLETASALWDLLLPVAPPILFEQDSAWSFARDAASAQKWLGWWKEFLASDTGGKGRPVSKDVFLQFLEFAIQSTNDLSSYNEVEDSWPSLIDAFVEWARQKTAMQE